ncbi:hypothetical protein, conserved [Leishmania lindenbergi]|uniref:EF-hand domain-containing protein n=1 Tax=Leishmania lindenbergi TaxID=651832 RepID=A0AAW3AG14_9TRYP
MPRSAEAVEELARRYYLTTALVEEAGRLFDAYAESGGAQPAKCNTESFITVSGLQRLMAKMGTSLSQQEVVELLRFFGSAAAVPFQEGGELSEALANSQQSPIGKRGSFTAATTAPASSQPSRQRRKKSGAMARKTDAKNAFASSPALALDHNAGNTASGDAASASSSPSTAPLIIVSPPSAVTTDGMSFSAFLYFLLVYPELAQRASATAATTSAFSAAALSGLDVNVPELFATIDTDADGVWGVHDLRYAAEACVMEDGGLLQDDPDLCRLVEMHPAELAAALHELDIDGDGVVTVDDVRHALYY